MIFGQLFVLFLIFILLHRAVAEFSGVVVEFFSHFVDFQSCFGLISSGFCQCWFDLVEFGSIASHFCQLFADFCLFWQIVVWFSSFLAVFSACSFRANSFSGIFVFMSIVFKVPDKISLGTIIVLNCL